MMKSTAEKLSYDKIQQLLAAVGANAGDTPTGVPETVDYDWRQPRYFNLAQLEKVTQFAETVAGECVDEFSRLYQQECRVSVASAAQTYAAADDPAEQANYYIPFGTESQKPLGVLRIPKASALAWTGQVLGMEEKSGQPDRALSKLEESFLSDIAAGLIRAFSRAYGRDLKAGECVRERAFIELQGSEERLEIVVEEHRTESPRQAGFVICCDKLESIVGAVTHQNKPLSAAQVQQVIIEHVHRVPVSVRVELATVTLPFKDVLELQVDDIVVLDKAITDTVSVFIEDRLCFQGRPAQSDGKHAVVIV